jgi:hypothetical protein
MVEHDEAAYADDGDVSSCCQWCGPLPNQHGLVVLNLWTFEGLPLEAADASVFCAGVPCRTLLPP